ncbi:MAG: hypothetical protein ABH950_05765 [Candidatus Altiarchaeota archaeon]
MNNKENETSIEELQKSVDELVTLQKKTLGALKAYEHLTPALVLVIVSVTVSLLGQLSDTVRNVTLIIGFIALLLSCYILHKSTTDIRKVFKE